jgi:hypothetical protein
MSRYLAFLIHLGISLLIFVSLAAVIFYWWYPGIFFETDGGWQGIRIIALVDLVLGPCLTLVVFKAGKPGLRFDLTAIGLFQAFCLAGGTWVVHSERPIAMVMVDDIFYSMSADDYRDANVEPPDLRQFEGRGPKWVTVQLPDDLNEQSDIRSRSLTADTPLRILHERYIPFEVSHLDVERSTPEADLVALDAHTGAIPKWLEQHGGSMRDYSFYPLGTRYKFIHLGVDKRTGKIVGLLPTPIPK